MDALRLWVGQLRERHCDILFVGFLEIDVEVDVEVATEPLMVVGKVLL